MGPTQRHALGEGRVPSLPDRGRADRDQPGSRRHQGRRLLLADGAGGRRGVGAAAAHHRGPEDPARAVRRRRFDLRHPPRRGRRLLRRRSRRRSLGDDGARVMRQALAGMLWSKQFYYYDVDVWLEEHGAHPSRGGRRPRAQQRLVAHAQRPRHLDARQVGVPVVRRLGPRLPLHRAGHGRRRLRQAAARPDAEGELPASQRADPRLRVELRRRQPAGARLGDLVRLQPREARPPARGTSPSWRAPSRSCCSTSPGGSTARTPPGRNVFEGGFLGLDNIGVFDRSAPLPTGGRLEQADGTAWMALFSQNMLEISLELARRDPLYADMAVKFAHHFLEIAAAMDRMGERADEMWDETDGFFYDLLRLPDGRAERLGVRSMVGLLPLCAVTVMPAGCLRRHSRGCATASATCWPATRPHRQDRAARGPRLRRPPPARHPRRAEAAARPRPHARRERVPGPARHPRAVAPSPRPSVHARVHGEEYRVDYQPAESNSGMFGGNSNWRGPVWMPVNVLILRALLQYYSYYGDAFKIECPTGSGRQMTLYEVARHLAGRLAGSLPARPARAPSRLRRRREVPVRSALARPPPLLRVLPRRQRRRHRRQPSDRLDRNGRGLHADVRPRQRGRGVLEEGRRALRFSPAASEGA